LNYSDLIIELSAMNYFFIPLIPRALRAGWVKYCIIFYSIIKHKYSNTFIQRCITSFVLNAILTDGCMIVQGKYIFVRIAWFFLYTAETYYGSYFHCPSAFLHCAQAPITWVPPFLCAPLRLRGEYLFSFLARRHKERVCC